MPYQAYGVYVPNKGYVREWQFLPKGVVFDPDQRGRMAMNSNTGTNVFGTTALTRFTVAQPGTGSAAMPPMLAAVSFLPNGQLNQRGESDVAVWLREGWVDEENPARPFFVANRAFYCLGIQTLTGQIQLSEF